MTKLLQVVMQRSPVGFLGFERGVYRFHYLSSQTGGPAISPLMPTSRVFYESDQLFGVFEQFLPKGLNAADASALSVLERTGHYGLGHLSFVNPDRPVVAPRMTLRKEALLRADADSFEQSGEFGRGLHDCGVLALEGVQMRLVHTLPASPYPDSCLYWSCQSNSTTPLGEVAAPAAADTFEAAASAGLRTPAFETGRCTQTNRYAETALIQRPDLSAAGRRLTAHRLFSLAGLSSSEARQLPNGDKLLLSLRLLRFYGQSSSNCQRVESLAGKADWFCPLSQIWLIEGECWFMP